MEDTKKSLFKKEINKEKIREKSTYPPQINTQLIMSPQTFNCNNVLLKLAKHCQCPLNDETTLSKIKTKILKFLEKPKIKTILL